MVNMEKKDQQEAAVTKHSNLRGEYGFEFVGGYKWLDFVNTELVRTEGAVDLLGDVADLVRWLRESGLIASSESKAALEHWGGSTEGEHLLRRAKEFRKTLREASERLGEDGFVTPALVEEVNELLAQRLGHHELEHTPEGFEVRFHALPDGPETLLAPVAESVARSLVESDSSLVKNCENPECILFFYDTSKNHTRRWCSMSTCGNRMKARMHYERAQGRARENREKSND